MGILAATGKAVARLRTVMTRIPEHTVKVGTEFIEVSEEVSYRGKTCHPPARNVVDRMSHFLDDIGRSMHGSTE